jgi:CHAT domain-containing protein
LNLKAAIQSGICLVAFFYLNIYSKPLPQKEYDSKVNELFNKIEDLNIKRDKENLFNTFDKLITLSKAQNESNDVLLALDWKAYYYYQFNEIEKYYQTTREISNISQELLNKNKGDSILYYYLFTSQYNIYNFYNLSGRLNDAFEGFQKLLKDIENLKEFNFDSLSISITIYLGTLAKGLKYYNLSISYIKKHINLLTKNGDQNSIAMAYYLLSQTYMSINQPDLAWENLQKAASLHKTIQNNKTTYRQNLVINTQIVFLLIEKQTYDEAISLGTKTYAQIKNFDFLQTPRLLYWIAYAHYLNKDFKKANQFVSLLYNTYSKQKFTQPLILSKTKLLEADILLEIDKSKAISKYKESLETLYWEKQKNIDTLSKEYLEIHLSCLSKNLKFNFDEAIIYKILKTVDYSRNVLYDESDKYFIIYNSYKSLENCLFELDQQENPNGEIIHQVFERIKSLNLLEAHENAKTLNISKKQSKEEKLIKELKAISTKIEELNDNNNQNSFYNKQLNERYIAITLQIDSIRKKESSLSFKGDSHSNSIIDFSILRKSLPKNNALIQYVFGKNNTYCFFIHQDTIHLKIINLSQKEITEYVNTYTQNLTSVINSNLMYDYNKSLNEYKKVSYILYEKLVKDIIPNRLKLDYLIISPDGILNNIPFEALITEYNHNQKTFKNLPYLINDFNISYTFSSTLHYKMKTVNKNNNKNLIAFAPDFDMDYKSEKYLSPIPSNKDEVKKISQLTRSKIFYGEKAKKKNFIKNASNYNVIHLATHGFSDNEKSQNSYISFSQFGKEINENEKLYLRDLYSFPLNAEMIVLSACETNLGKYNQGEGVASIARAFAYAGCNSIITSLWKVNQKTTAELMKSYYFHLTNGLDKSEALRQSKLELMNKSSVESHPYYWAGFIVLGNEEALALAKPFLLVRYQKIIWILGIFTLLALTFYLFRSMKSKMN